MSGLLRHDVRWPQEQKIEGDTYGPSIIAIAQALTHQIEAQIRRDFAGYFSFLRVQVDAPRAAVARVLSTVAYAFRTEERIDTDQFVVHRDLRTRRLEALNGRLQLLHALSQTDQLTAQRGQLLGLALGRSGGLLELLAELVQGELQTC